MYINSKCKIFRQNLWCTNFQLWSISLNEFTCRRRPPPPRLCMHSCTNRSTQASSATYGHDQAAAHAAPGRVTSPPLSVLPGCVPRTTPTEWLMKLRGDAVITKPQYAVAIFSLFARYLGFAPLPLPYLGGPGALLVVNLLMVEGGKQWFYRRHRTA